MNIDINKLPININDLPGEGGYKLSYDYDKHKLNIIRCNCICHRENGVMHVTQCCTYPYDGVLSFRKSQIPAQYIDDRIQHD